MGSAVLLVWSLAMLLVMAAEPVAVAQAAAEPGNHPCMWRLQKDGNWKATLDMRNTDSR
jgi:hypothetical protein